LLKRQAEFSAEEDIMANPEEMYQCQTTNCGCIYDPDRGDRKGKVSKGTCFDDLPDEWKCPVCGARKRHFKPLAGPGSAREDG
jgi:rubredoxin